jgi:hypothetical protein
VPLGVPLRDPNKSLDMRLGAVSEEIAGSDGSEPWAEGLIGPFGMYVATGAADCRIM